MPTAPTLPGSPPAATPILREDGTWFDEGVGVLCGMMSSGGYTLGLTESPERPALYPGDYVDVSQSVDLTDQDIITLTASMTGLTVNAGLEQPGYLSPSDTLLHYRMNEAGNQARDESYWEHDLLVEDGTITTTVPTYNGGYGLARTWGTGAGRLVGTNSPQVIVPATGLAEYTVDWWQNFDVDAIATSNNVSPIIFQLRSRTAGGLRVRWLGTPGGGSHSWQLQLEHWDGGVYEAQNLAATLRAANQGNEFFSIAFDNVTLSARVFLNGALVGTFGPFATLPGQPLGTASIIIGDPLYRGMIDDVRLSETNHLLADHQSDYATRLDVPTAYDVAWWLHIRIDGEYFASCQITADADGRPAVLKAPVRMLPAGVHTVAARLSLENA